MILASCALINILNGDILRLIGNSGIKNHISFKLSKRSVAYPATTIKTLFVHFFYNIKKNVQINISLFCQNIDLFKSFQFPATTP